MQYACQTRKVMQYRNIETVVAAMFRENVRGFAQQKRRFGQTGGLRGELPPRTQGALSGAVGFTAGCRNRLCRRTCGNAGRGLGEVNERRGWKTCPYCVGRRGGPSAREALRAKVRRVRRTRGRRQARQPARTKKKPGRRSRPGVMGETPDQYLLKAEGSSSSTSTVPAFFRASS